MSTRIHKTWRGWSQHINWWEVDPEKEKELEDEESENFAVWWSNLLPQGFNPSNFFAGKKLVFDGRFTKSRPELVELIQSVNGVIARRVNANTDLVISNGKRTTKQLQHAIDNQIPIWNEERFLAEFQPRPMLHKHLETLVEEVASNLEEAFRVEVVASDNNEVSWSNLVDLQYELSPTDYKNFINTLQVIFPGNQRYRLPFLLYLWENDAIHLVPQYRSRESSSSLPIRLPATGRLSQPYTPGIAHPSTPKRIEFGPSQIFPITPPLKLQKARRRRRRPIARSMSLSEEELVEPLSQLSI